MYGGGGRTMDITEGFGSGVGLAVCKLREIDVFGGEVFCKSRLSNKRFK